MELPISKFYDWERKAPNRIFLKQPIDGQYHSFTWRQVGEQARKLATFLKEQLPPNSKVALMSKNCAEWVITDLAIMMAGHVSVPLFPNLSHESILKILDHSGSKLIFIGKLDDYSFAEVLPFAIKKVSFPGYGPDMEFTWGHIMETNQPMEASPVPNSDDLAIIMYTSGTTGQHKGVMHSHANLAFAGTRFTQLLKLTKKDRVISHLPMCHAAEKMLVQMPAYYAGSSIYFVESIDTFLRDLKYVRPTFFGTVPRLWIKFQMGVLEKVGEKKFAELLKTPILGSLVRKKIKRSLGLDQSKIFVGGSAPIQPAVLEWFNKLGICIREIYGMTENASYSHANIIGKVKLGTVGKALPECDVKLGDENEILVKHDALMTGYYKEPELTANSFTSDGYLRTGDIGEVDEEGYMRIVGRIKDQFKTSRGKYVSPEELENRIGAHTYIEQVCVVGSGLSQPIALVVLSELAKDQRRKWVEKELTTYLIEVNAGLASFEQIKSVIIVSEAWTIENERLTPTLKLKRRNIESEYGAQLADWADSEEAIQWEKTAAAPEPA